MCVFHWFCYVLVLSVAYLAYVLVEIIVYEIMSRDEEFPCVAPDLTAIYCIVVFVITQTLFIIQGTSVSMQVIVERTHQRLSAIPALAPFSQTNCQAYVVMACSHGIPIQDLPSSAAWVPRSDTTWQ